MRRGLSLLVAVVGLAVCSAQADEKPAAPAAAPKGDHPVVTVTTSLGAFELEMHYAIYPPGAGYARHRDRFRDDDARVLSCIAYLNDGWRAGDGGALRMHLDGGARDVAPAGGTLVAFLSDRVEHEVLPARRDRIAVSGWFRRRG